MYSEVTLPVLAVYGRRVLFNPGGTGNKPLLGVFTDFIYPCTFQCLFGVGEALV